MNFCSILSGWCLNKDWIGKNAEVEGVVEDWEEDNLKGNPSLPIRLLLRGCCICYFE